LKLRARLANLGGEHGPFEPNVSIFTLLTNRGSIFYVQRLFPSILCLWLLAGVNVFPQRTRVGIHRIEAQISGPDAPMLMDKTAQTGARWILIRAHWVFIEPGAPAGPAPGSPGAKSGVHAYDWVAVDDAVKLGRSRGLNVALQLTKAPDWATGARAGCGGDLGESDDDCGRITNAKKDLFKNAWEDLCYNAGLRYSSDVQHFVLWNEPNLRPNFNPEGPYDNVVNEYWRLIAQPGRAGIKTANPGARVVGPEISTLNSYWGNWRDNGVDPLLRFFPDAFDVFTVHSYNANASVTLAKMAELRQEMTEHGLLGIKPVWLTEFNFQSGTCNLTDQQLEPQVEAVYNNMDTSWWAKSFYFNLSDGGGTCGFGLLHSPSYFAPFAPKPIYTLFSSFVDLQQNTPPASPAFVRQLYADMLNRLPDAIELNSLVGALSATGRGRSFQLYPFGRSRVELISDFYEGQWFQNTAAFVVRAYSGILARRADYEGFFRAWLDLSAAREGKEQTLEDLINSTEFQTRFGRNLTNREFVRRLYLNVLLREPDPAGWASFTEQLDRGSKTRAQLAREFMESAEFIQKTGLSVFIQSMYLALLRREPSEGEFSLWLGGLSRGDSGLHLINAIRNSAEYQARF
jgi:hypothetical protein